MQQRRMDDGVIESGSRALARYAIAMGLALAPLVFLLDDPNWINILAFTYLMGGAAAAWNVIGGFGGQFSLAHGVFFGIGAYLTAGLMIHFGWSPWMVTLPVAVVSGAVAALISWPTFRLRGPFFAIATLAFNEVAFVLANHLESLTGGPRGLMIPFRPGFANMIFRERWQYALLMFAFAALVIGACVWLRRTRLGYYLLAVREDEDAARAAGIDVLRTKLAGMALSAAMTSVGGTLFAVYLRFIDPPSLFTLTDVGVKFALLALIGGVGTVYGPLLGAALVVPFESWLRSEWASDLPGASQAVLGLVMVMAALFMKRGIVGAWGQFHRKRRERRKQGTHGAAREVRP